MPPIEELTQQSLRDYGLAGTLAILSLIFAIVFFWKRPPPQPHASPIQAVDEKTKLLPLILEEVRQLGRGQREIRDQLDHMEDRMARMETLGEIIKDRQGR